jgi:hypothetical protein
MVDLACAPSQRSGPPPKPEAAAAVVGSAPVAIDAPDAGPPAPAPPPAAATTAPDAATPTANPKLKIVTIGMHVAGGPFDEATKEPFKKAVEPHFPEIAQCWGKHVPHPPKQTDVGVDLLIEAGGGVPKVSNPRSTLGGGGPAILAETEGLIPCVVAVFESIVFPKLDRGRTGVSYSLRITP